MVGMVPSRADSYLAYISLSIKMLEFLYVQYILYPQLIDSFRIIAFGI